LYSDPNPDLKINNQADTDSNMQIIDVHLPKVWTGGIGGLPNYFTKPLVIHTYNSVLPAYEKNHLRELHYVRYTTEAVFFAPVDVVLSISAFVFNFNSPSPQSVLWILIRTISILGFRSGNVTKLHIRIRICLKKIKNFE
jgi:hypothetical protein